MKFRSFAVFLICLVTKITFQSKFDEIYTLYEIVGLKIKILGFYSLNREGYQVNDEMMQSRSLLEGQSTEYTQYLKSIILNLQK